MKIIAQFSVLFLVCMAGIFLSRLFSFPMPASVCAMLVLFCLLSLKILKPESLQELSDFLLGNMALFFVPSGVGILAHMDTLKGNVLLLILICCVTTLVTFAASVSAVWAATKLQNTFKNKIGEN